MRKLFFAAALLFLATTSFSQSVWRWGVKAGANFPFSSTKLNIQNNGFSSQDFTGKGRVGFFAGGTLELSPGDSASSFRLQVEANYNLMYLNYNLRGSGKLNEADFKNMQQINIPILMKIFVTPQFSVNLGPSANINITGKENQFGTDNTPIPAITLGSHALKTFQLGAVVGGTYNFYKNWNVDFRYNYLFGHINNTNNSDPEVSPGFPNIDGKVKWSELQLGIGYVF